MEFLSLQPFVPSGPDYEKAREFFKAIGFIEEWEQDGYTGFVNQQCRFILQRFNDESFAQNMMISVGVPDAKAFYEACREKGIEKKFGVRINPPVHQPYGLEVNVIDPAGVCWHVVQSR